jgi:UDP-N-acetyl-D-galactosamine dehydrogenase
VDPWASEREACQEYGITLQPMNEASDADCVIFAVAHNEFKNMTMDEISKLYKDMPQADKILIDVKGLFDIKSLEESGMTWWRL